MSSERNKFDDLFVDAETSNDVRTILFSNCDGLSEQEFSDLKEAYLAANARVSKREFEVMWRLVGIK